MAYAWKILRSAVEQEILFPSMEAYEAYIRALDKKSMVYEVLEANTTASGEIMALMKKPYNNNVFLYSKKTNV